MNKFRKWMGEKKYARRTDDGNFVIYGRSIAPVYPTKQMLIGYMMEYCVLNNISFQFSTRADCHKAGMECCYDTLVDYIEHPERHRIEEGR